MLPPLRAREQASAGAGDASDRRTDGRPAVQPRGFGFENHVYAAERWHTEMVSCRKAPWPPGAWFHGDEWDAGALLHVTETNRIHLALCDMHNRTLGPYFGSH
jgi:hypothetical protein